MSLVFTEVLMARQPIYDRRMKLFAYELLYRSNCENFAPANMTREDIASSLANILVEIGIDQLVGKNKALVNVSQDLLESDALRLLPAGQVILELLEDLKMTDANQAHVKDLLKRGYAIALDDYIFDKEQEKFLPLASLIKVDVMGVEPAILKRRIRELKKPGVKLLAEKVETHEMHRACMEMGFDYFQGYFFAKPEIVKGRALPKEKSDLAQLLAKLQDPDVTFSELEMLISRDVALSYRLLKLINSASFGLSQTVDSIRQALMFLGLAKVVALASLLTIAAIGSKPTELLLTAMIRANACESMAQEMDMDTPQAHFTTGLFSVIDAFMDQPMEQLLEALPLSPQIKGTLTGTMPTAQTSQTLEWTLAMERGDWEVIPAGATKIAEIYRGAIAWATQTNSDLAA